MSEGDLQVAVAELLDHLGWLWCHPPNGGARNAVTGARLKREGVKPGVPDVLIFEDWEDYETKVGPAKDWWAQGHGVAIELKHGKGRVSPKQREWLEGLEARGWLVRECRTLDEVLAAIAHVRPRNRRRL